MLLAPNHFAPDASQKSCPEGFGQPQEALSLLLHEGTLADFALGLCSLERSDAIAQQNGASGLISISTAPLPPGPPEPGSAQTCTAPSPLWPAGGRRLRLQSSGRAAMPDAESSRSVPEKQTLAESVTPCHPSVSCSHWRIPALCATVQGGFPPPMRTKGMAGTAVRGIAPPPWPRTLRSSNLRMHAALPTRTAPLRLQEGCCHATGFSGCRRIQRSSDGGLAVLQHPTAGPSRSLAFFCSVTSSRRPAAFRREPTVGTAPPTGGPPSPWLRWFRPPPGHGPAPPRGRPLAGSGTSSPGGPLRYR